MQISKEIERSCMLYTLEVDTPANPEFFNLW